MSRGRLNVFLDRDHAKRLNELAAIKGLSKSAIVAAAIASFLSPEGADRREAQRETASSVGSRASMRWWRMPSPQMTSNVPGAKSIFSGVGFAMIGVLWAYEGWQYVTFSAGEAINAQRNFPRSLLIGSASLIGIYLLANLAYLAALGPTKAAQTNAVASAAMTAVAGPAASKLVTLAILISIFSATNGITLTAPRVYYAMARDGVFFHQLARIHPRFRTPAFAVIAGSAWAIILAATGTFEQLLTYVVFTGWLFYALGAASIFIYRRRILDHELPYRVPGFPWTPLLFIIAAAALVLNTIVTQFDRTAIGLGIVLIGTPAYFIWHRRSKPR